MAETFDTDRMQQMFDRLASLLVRNGVPKEAALAALEKAYANHEADLASDAEPEQITRLEKILMGNLLSLWAQLPQYCDDAGEPLPIPIAGLTPSFEDLLNRTIEQTDEVTNGPTPGVALQLLLERNVVVPDDEGRYRRALDFFPSSPQKRANPGLLLDYLDDYVHTAEHNLRHGGGTGHFQRVAQVSGFPLAQVPIINKLTNESGMAFLRTMDAAIMELAADSTPNTEEEKTNIGVGVYFYARNSLK
jgi:hypothetical protein